DSEAPLPPPPRPEPAPAARASTPSEAAPPPPARTPPPAAPSTPAASPCPASVGAPGRGARPATNGRGHAARAAQADALVRRRARGAAALLGVEEPLALGRHRQRDRGRHGGGCDGLRGRQRLRRHQLLPGAAPPLSAPHGGRPGPLRYFLVPGTGVVP